MAAIVHLPPRLSLFHVCSTSTDPTGISRVALPRAYAARRMSGLFRAAVQKVRALARARSQRFAQSVELVRHMCLRLLRRRNSAAKYVTLSQGHHRLHRQTDVYKRGTHRETGASSPGEARRTPPCVRTCSCAHFAHAYICPYACLPESTGLASRR